MSLLSNLKLNYDRTLARRDLIAGLTVAAIALPQGMAYATAPQWTCSPMRFFQKLALRCLWRLSFL